MAGPSLTDRRYYVAAMAVELRKHSIDLGIVVKDSTTALGFYRDLLEVSGTVGKDPYGEDGLEDVK